MVFPCETEEPISLPLIRQYVQFFVATCSSKMDQFNIAQILERIIPGLVDESDIDSESNCFIVQGC